LQIFTGFSYFESLLFLLSKNLRSSLHACSSE
jgi:hypothetical protein